MAVSVGTYSFLVTCYSFSRHWLEEVVALLLLKTLRTGITLFDIFPG